MKYRTSLISKRLIYSLFLFSITFFAGMAAQGQDQRVVLQKIHLREGERVYGIELSINAGSFVGFDPLPMGWYLIIDNDPSQQTSISGDARVGAAALQLDELLKLKIVARKVEYGDLKFSISGTLNVMNKSQSQRQITLHPENFKIIEGSK